MQFPVAYLNSNDGTGILGFGGETVFRHSGTGTISLIEKMISENSGSYIFGALSYDLKNEIYPLNSENTDRSQFPDILFFIPQYVVRFEREKYRFIQGTPDSDALDFLNKLIEEETDQGFFQQHFSFQETLTKEEYITQVESLRSHIQRGDIYEVNFCQEFFAENCDIKDKLDTYFKLNAITKAPFSSFFSCEEFTVFCGSPERYIKKEGSRLISQPIKGTAPRKEDPMEDEDQKFKLFNDPKERSENVMIVDLVRNDLSKVAQKNSVKVDELFGIYSFETVHQMISTISCELKENVSFTDILRAAFPMGSMTGAPKLRAMQLIESHENFKRGLYSGSIGYIDPKGDFDFNVVIRTVIHNQITRTLSCSVGSAITISSDPEKEFEECQIKVGRIIRAFNE